MSDRIGKSTENTRSTSSDPGPIRNTSWLYSTLARHAIRTAITPVRVIEEATRDITEHVQRGLDAVLSDSESEERQICSNIETEREYSFGEIDISIVGKGNSTDVVNTNRRQRPYISRTPSRISEYGEFELTSYDSSIFDPNEFRERRAMSQPDYSATDVQVDAAIDELRTQIESRENRRMPANAGGGTEQVTGDITVDILQEIRSHMAALYDYVHTQNTIIHEQIRELKGERNQQRHTAEQITQQDATDADVSYGRTATDIRNRTIHSTAYMQLKEARSIIPEMDGTSQNKIQEFISASTYAMESINPADEAQLLKAILCTKFKGRAMLDFQTKDIQTFKQLKDEVEACYTTRKSITHLQLEFNTLKQKQGESVQAYGLRVDQLAMKLYESTIEGKGHTPVEKNTIKNIIQGQALQNFQIGLHEDIKMIVRSRTYNNLQEAIAVAASEEKMKGPSTAFSRPNYKVAADARGKAIQCQKCGRNGHIERDCRIGKYSLPRPNGTRVNAVDKHCSHCKKSGHNRGECWLLNSRTGKSYDPKDSTRNKNGGIMRNTGNKMDNSDEEIGNRRQIKEVQTAYIKEGAELNTDFDLITLPMVEAKGGKINMLVDTGAALTLVKARNFKGETALYDGKITLIGATGREIDTLGVVIATVQLKNTKIKHKIHIVANDFPLKHEGLLGADFLREHVTRWDYPAKRITFGKDTLSLFPYREIILAPRSETIVQATTSKNMVGVVQATETKPGVIIGCCLVKAQGNTCPVSIINTTEEEIKMQTPHVSIEPLESEAEIGIIEVKESPEISRPRGEQIKSLLRLEHLNIEERKAIINICEEYSDIFHLEGEPLTCTKAMKHEIATRAGVAPANTRPYRLPEKHKAEVNKQVQEMLKNKIIQPSASQWNAPLLVVPKKLDASGKPKWRVVVDFRKVNDVTIGDSFPLPNITDILDQLGNSKYFTTLDLASGYHQIPMAERDTEKTAFSTPFGHYEFKRMPFGLKNAPATFQRLMNTVLAGIQGIRCLVYLDDIVIYGASLQEHNRRLTEVFQRIRENQLKLQPDKCEFLRKEVVYLGHIITENGIKPDPSKIKAVQNFPTPRKIKEIQAFIGLAGYYRKFIENFSKIVKPLTKLTQKGVKFEWGQEQQNAFDHLKEKLVTAPVLKYPDFSSEFVLTTDASDFAIGAILSQGKIRQDRPIAYASRVLSKAELNYSTTEKELLAIVWGVKHFRPYLYGTKFKVVTDHRPLVWLFNVTDPGSRLIRWRLKLEEYDYEIIHKAGKSNTNADALSRNVAQEIHVVSKNRKVEEEERDTESDNESDTNEERENIGVKETDNYTEEDKRQILYEYHDAPTGGHQGVQRTIRRIRLQHNWKGLTKDVENYIAKCGLCQKNKLMRRNKAPLIITDTPSKPFEKCALDIVGPLTVTNEGNKYILTFQDNFTKLSKAMPLANQEASTIAKEFVTKIIFEYGLPEKILTDQGTNFMSEVFKNVCRLLKIEKIRTSAYHPETNGALERSHRTLAEYLRHFINEEQTDWDEWLPYAMFTYNTTPHTATGSTPYELLYGHQVTLPTALTREPKLTYSYDDYVSELRERLRAAHSIAKEKMKDEKRKAKKCYDKKTKDITFGVGDKVLLYDETLRRGRSKKLEALWRGPYTIINKNSDVNFTIKTGRKSLLVHANRLKLFVEN